MKGETPYSILKSIIVAIVVICFSIPHCAAQQKVQFTQYMFNELIINPAYAGADEALSLTFIQRNQWTSIENAPSTQTFSAHTLVKKKKFGVGLSVVNDKIGAHKNLSALGDFAYHIQTGLNSYLSMGVQAGMHNMRSNYATLTGAVNDPKLSDLNVTETFFDFGAGIYFRSPKFHAGLSAPELVPKRISFNDTVSVKLSRTNLFLFSKYTFRISENTDLEPTVLLKHLSGLPLSYDVTLSMIYRKVLSLGFSYRKDESVDFLIKAQITPQLQFGYAYDHTISNVASLSGGSHEIMVHYLFRYVQTKVSSPR